MIVHGLGEGWVGRRRVQKVQDFNAIFLDGILTRHHVIFISEFQTSIMGADDVYDVLFFFFVNHRFKMKCRSLAVPGIHSLSSPLLH